MNASLSRPWYQSPRSATSDAFKAEVSLSRARVGSEVVAEVEEVDPHRGAVFDRVHKEAPGDAVAFAEDVLRLTQVSCVGVAEALHSLLRSFRQVEARDAYGDVDRGLPRKAWDGCA